MQNLFQNTEVAYDLKKTSQIRKSIFLFSLITRSFLVKILSAVTLFFLKLGFPIKWLLKATIYEQFCGGVNISECSDIIKRMKKKNVFSILDYSIESLQNEKDFDNAFEKKLTIIKLSKENDMPFSVFKPTSLGSYKLFKKKSSKEIKGSDNVQNVAEQFNAEINELVKQVEDLKRTNPGLKINFDENTKRYSLNMDFTELKKIISRNYPTVVFGSSNTALTDATFSSIRDSDFKNLQLIRQGRALDKTPTGKDASGLPIKVQPTNLRVSMLGCPLTYYGQSLFFDFNTGTSVDDVYYVQTIQHSIRPGEFNTNLTLSTRDSDGKFESLLNTLSSAQKTIDEAEGTLGELIPNAIKPS